MKVWNSRGNIFKRGSRGWRKRQGYYVRKEKAFQWEGVASFVWSEHVDGKGVHKATQIKGKEDIRGMIYHCVNLVLSSRKMTSLIPPFCGIRWSGSVTVWGGSKCVAGWDQLLTSQGASGHSSLCAHCPPAEGCCCRGTGECCNRHKRHGSSLRRGSNNNISFQSSLQHTSNKCAVFPHWCLLNMFPS